MSFFKQLNWIDIFVVILVIRVCYVALKTGFPAEIFKLVGTICAIFLACHYYIRVSNFLSSHLSLEGATAGNLLNFLSFFALASLGYFVFVIMRVIFAVLIRMEAVSLLNRWGAFILGVGRFCLFISLLFFAITIANINYLKNSLSDSLLGPKIFRLTPKVYESLWNSLMFRFMNEGTFNKSVLGVDYNSSG